MNTQKSVNKKQKSTVDKRDWRHEEMARTDNSHLSPEEKILLAVNSQNDLLPYFRKQHNSQIKKLKQNEK